MPQLSSPYVAHPVHAWWSKHICFYFLSFVLLYITSFHDLYTHEYMKIFFKFFSLNLRRDQSNSTPTIVRQKSVFMCFLCDVCFSSLSVGFIKTTILHLISKRVCLHAWVINVRRWHTVGKNILFIMRYGFFPIFFFFKPLSEK